MLDITLIHPKVVDFIIALFSMAIVFDLVGFIAKKDSWHFAAWINLIFAGAAALLGVGSGLLAANSVPHSDAAHEIMQTHKILGFILLGTILALLVWRILLKGKFPAKARLSVFALRSGRVWGNGYRGVLWRRDGLHSRRGGESRSG